MQAAARKEAKKKRNANKWIFVTSADGQQLYVAPKVKGNFQHSSFLAGEQTTTLSWVSPLNALYTGLNIAFCKLQLQVISDSDANMLNFTAAPLWPLLWCNALPGIWQWPGCSLQHIAA